LAKVKYTLVTEGPTDQALIHIINWLFKAQQSDLAVNFEWADPALLPTKTRTLADKIRYGLKFFPCDVLFVHRDSDDEQPTKRQSEIEEAISSIKGINRPHICVVPIRTTEAWFLFDEKAIRDYVGNPDGKADLNLPKLSAIEEVSRPKIKLSEAFEFASKSKGRRKKSCDNTASLVALALSIENYAPLRVLPAFKKLEDDIKAYLASRRE
jgi:hypothetical protein